MKKRYKIPSGKSKKDFSRNAATTHRKNLAPTTTGPMRGGIRL